MIRNNLQAYILLNTTDTANKDSQLQMAGGGNCQVPLVTSENDIAILDLSDTAYAPNAHCNLLSPALLARKAPLQGRWDAIGATIEDKHNVQIGFARQHEGLDQVNVVIPAVDKTVSGFVGPVLNLEDDIWLWRRRLGHLGWSNMRKPIKMSDGCPITDEQTRAKLKTISPICVVTKALNKIPRELARRRATNMGELIHVDQWGLYAIFGYNGYRYSLHDRRQD